MSTHRLPEIIPSLQSLTLGTPGDVLDLAFLNRFECLTDLQLACSGFNVPTSIVLPHVRSLALTSTSPEMISELLSPNILPSLRSLGICFAPNHRLLSNPRLLSLFSQVEVLCIRISTWNSFTGEERLKFTSRTLIEAYSAQLGFIAETAMEATNMCVQGLGDFLEEEEGLNEEIKSSIKRFIQTLRRAKTIRLRLLYFEEDPRGNPELPEEAEELIDELLEECRKREIEVVFARLPSEIEMDSYILADFEARQQKLARQGGSG
ncbi:uncharacterized protein JCM6883_007470 [Sporobolomyces salmoneus]|uniref:uncharacterized protein n=1 Tax=Sporobolomyces salmoneus TaxID=183962 RepID=UPI00317A7BE7